MAKRVILDPPGYTFSQFSLLTGHTSKECALQDVSLYSSPADVDLRLPLMSAAMTSVTGREMVLALGREGGLPVIPANIDELQMVRWIEEVKDEKMGFVEDPLKARENDTIEHVLKNINERGHTRVPVCDRNNHFLGMFEEEHFYISGKRPSDLVTLSMIPCDDLLCTEDENLSIDDARNILSGNSQKYVVVLDDQRRLVKMAFKKDMLEAKVAAAITTYEG